MDLFRKGADGLPGIFRVWLELREKAPGSAVAYLVTWHARVTEAVRLGLHDEYACMFPSPFAPAPSTLPMPYLFMIAMGPHGFEVYNPILGYEKIRGYGTWPADMPFERLVPGGKTEELVAISPAERRNPRINELIELLRTLISQPPRVDEYPLPERGSSSEERGRNEIAPDPANEWTIPSIVGRLVRRGPEGICACVRLWTETGECGLMEALDFCLREGCRLGLVDRYPVLTKILAMSLGDALAEKAIIRLEPCRLHDELADQSCFNVDVRDREWRDAGATPLPLSRLLNDCPTYSGGFLTVINPITVYESVCGRGSWPKDLPLDRIQSPEKSG